MSHFAKEITYYLSINVLKATLLAWFVLLGFFLLSDFYNNFTNIGKHGFTLNYAALVTIFSTPQNAYELLPVAGVIGLLLGLGQMAAKSELIAMGSVGISRQQIAFGALLPAIILSGVMFFTNETLGTKAEKQVLAYNVYKANKITLAKYTGVWAKDGELFFNSRSGVAKGKGEKAWLELADVRLYRFDQNGVLQSITQAKTANNKAKYWQLYGVEKTSFAKTVSIEQFGTVPWKTNITDESLEASLTSPRYLSIGELSSNIDYLEQNKLDASAFTKAYWGRWFYPFKTIVLCLSILPFAFSSLRTGGLGKSLFLGILVGVSSFVLERLFVNLADVFRIDVRLAYFIAPMSVFGLCWGVLAKRI
ncbi:MAG: LPS export ABC transporter permease LptG [Arenimonas sp.]|nr:LPS export ABC transporter permease LptG [Arenimonas sp.]